jgi:hypothetical protein
MNVFVSAINDAEDVYNEGIAGPKEVNSTISALKNAISTFKSKRILHSAA